MLNSALLSTPLGRFTLLADNAGLCGVLFPGEEENRPAQSLSDISTHPLLMETGRQLLAYLEGRLRTFDLPLSVHGTSFQQTVWAQLCSIPYGHTMTYGQLAERIGNRNKARAVGGAAHANPIGIIIPCHRLIGSDGRLTGFGGGLPMKQALLDLEQRHMGTKKEAEPEYVR